MGSGIDETSMVFEENGVEFVSFDYEFPADEEYSYSTSGTSPESFMIDINNFNIGEIEVEEETSIVADVDVVEIGSTSIKFKVTADVSDDVMCYLYGSTDIEGEKDSFIHGFNCNSEILLDELEPNTTYYFKSLVGYNTEFGGIMEITTKNVIEDDFNSDFVNNNSGVDSNGNITVNPTTGINITIFVIVVLMLFSVVGICVFVKKYVNNVL